jgi:16S rRNA (uracil1498-N3)-methyltransferase
MPAGRFVVDPVMLASGTDSELPSEVAHQVRDVLRLGPGDLLTLLDGEGGEWPAVVTVVDRKRVRVRVGDPCKCPAEPQTRVVLCPALLKASKLEWVLQKGTELGVAAFAPIVCERGRGGEDLGAAKWARWRRILVEATEQCGRASVPSLAEDPVALEDALTTLPSRAIGLMPWEGERAIPLRAALSTALAARDSSAPPEVWLLIGPEGGFAEGEVALAQAHGVLPVTLGPRILRAETAAIVAAALALDVCGDLG